MYILVDEDMNDITGAQFEDEMEAYNALDDYFITNYGSVLGTKDMYQAIEV